MSNLKYATDLPELRNDFKEKERFIFSMKLDHISIKKSLKAYFDKYYK